MLGTQEQDRGGVRVHKNNDRTVMGSLNGKHWNVLDVQVIAPDLEYTVLCVTIEKYLRPGKVGLWSTIY